MEKIYTDISLEKDFRDMFFSVCNLVLMFSGNLEVVTAKQREHLEILERMLSEIKSLYSLAIDLYKPE